MFKNKFRGTLGIFYALMIRFALLLLIYSAMRVGFFLFNRSLFPHVSATELWLMMLGGIKFDLVALLYINAPYILLMILPIPWKYTVTYQQIAKWIFIITNSFGFALNLIDYAYFPFTLKRTTGTVFQQFSNETNLLVLVKDFLIDYWYLLAVFILLMYAFIKVYDTIQVKSIRFNAKIVAIHFGIMLFVAFMFVGGVRGGWAHSTRPITLSNAGDYVKSPEEIPIVLNTPFSMLKTLGAVNLQPIHYFSEPELEKIYPVVHQPASREPFKDLNVVVLILESFGKEHVGALNTDIQNGQYKGYTPFLDSLIDQAYTFSHTYANGRKSIDALPSIISGIPSMGEPFVLSVYSGNTMTSLPSILADKGYQTAFFHGAPNGSMGFSAYTKLAGVQQYFGKNEYNNDKDFDGIWGIWDEPFLQFTAKKINTFKQPFFAGFFSLSSHHPFKVPEKYAGKFPKGPLEVQEPVGYTDLALKEFFETAKSMPWYENTLFVICADHATVSYLPEYKTAPNAFAIPIVFYYPGGELKGKSDRLVQQIDILPTVLNYMNYDKPYVAFGFDAFSNQKNNFVINSTGDVYNMHYKEYYMTYDGAVPNSFYDLKKDPLMKANLLNASPLVLDTMTTNMKAFVQQYNNRMINNKLAIP
ncbi:LTA synthase family protein [Sphingobacterium hungaricum]|uniref:Sulfatase n=1 Tax=Sphingobacterium hungaricum TaxID=2082723 RepID=A0A928YP61_9SPHI|nr:alkaline phosphatase family protein [Sphingobacterium hungaricum]MBE8712604.1 sulfatase [Sphingobacterium hungaricum]